MNERTQNGELGDAGKILVVDDHPAARASIADALTHCGHEVACAANAREALRKLPEADVDVVLTDLQMPGMDGLELIHRLQEESPRAEVVMITAHASVSTAVEAMRRGAFDYVEKPFDVERLDDVIRRAVAVARKRMAASAAISPAATCVLVGESPAMTSLRGRIAQVAGTAETVLITGESGSGKELVARAIHAQSRRAAGPFVDLNCPVLSAQLTESELFGHERGAFTGADQARIGRFEAANKGSLLLDEITEIDLPLQAKLLRVLQEQSFQRVGSNETVRVDVRVLATTNRDLAREVAAGRFRPDLYFRLNVVPVTVPPLRDRAEDVPRLVEHFQRQVAQRLGCNPPQLDDGALALLQAHRWPGNVRELQNIITRACVLHADQCVHAETLRAWLLEPQSQAGANAALPAGVSLREMERRLIETTLSHFEGHRRKTADALGIGLRTLTTKLKEYRLAEAA